MVKGKREDEKRKGGMTKAHPSLMHSIYITYCNVLKITTLLHALLPVVLIAATRQ
jgi:hypothetical protein